MRGIQHNSKGANDGAERGGGSGGPGDNGQRTMASFFSCNSPPVGIASSLSRLGVVVDWATTRASVGHFISPQPQSQKHLHYRYAISPPLSVPGRLLLAGVLVAGGKGASDGEMRAAGSNTIRTPCSAAPAASASTCRCYRAVQQWPQRIPKLQCEKERISALV
jgi:hypothetical protein